MSPHLSMVTLGVADLAKSIQFYRDGLGFPTRVESGTPLAFLSTHGTRLALCPRDRLEEFLGLGARSEGARFGGFRLGHCVREQARVAAVLEQAVKAGGKLARPAPAPKEKTGRPNRDPVEPRDAKRLTD